MNLELSCAGLQMNQSFVLAISESSQVGEARRVAGVLAQKQGFNQTEAGKFSLIATEAANNLVKHAQRGELILTPFDENGLAGMELLALDRGPGMQNVDHCMRDGYSTAGSPGTGLGAIARLSTSSDVYSLPNRGTALVSRISAGQSGRRQAVLEIGAICSPKAGEDSCGDAWCVRQSPGRAVALMADGLGHGSSAAQASREAVRAFEENSHCSPAEIIQAAYGPLRSTRGAALAVAELDFENKILRCAGVGNIAATIVEGDKTRSLISHNGTVGHEMRRVQEFTYPWPAGALLVMHSDGLQTRWSLKAYPGLAARCPSLIAGVLFRDFQRGSDDVTVLVIREH